MIKEIETGTKKIVSRLKRTKNWNKGTYGSHIKNKIKKKKHKHKDIKGTDDKAEDQFVFF